ncbi:MAG: hypothetical protein LBQ78_01635 [Tannerellaceae bacterium]|jgi:hypothetical protein|nr:hypothetical protein [Tannerellaceae bacterium]
MKEYSIHSFIQETAQSNADGGLYEQEKQYLLELNIRNQTVMIKKGGMVAYDGDVQLEVGATMMKVKGTGRVYVADYAKAHEETIRSNVKMMICVDDWVIRPTV